jgi:hypothetical protein
MRVDFDWYILQNMSQRVPKNVHKKFIFETARDKWKVRKTFP